jgi:hypothetical protein
MSIKYYIFNHVEKNQKTFKKYLKLKKYPRKPVKKHKNLTKKKKKFKRSSQNHYKLLQNLKTALLVQTERSCKFQSTQIR